MNRVLSIIEDEGISCFRCEQLNLDFERFSEYQESDEHPADHVFERPTPSVDKYSVAKIDDNVPSIFKYFLDGSRRTYKVADVIIEGRYMPIIAGQVGVAVSERRKDSKDVMPIREFCRFDNVIAFPNTIEKRELKEIQDKINSKSPVRFIILGYDVSKIDTKDPVNLGIARIMRHMQDLEVETINNLSSANYLNNDTMLMLDGPLRFKEMQGRNLDKYQFRNVVGVSKTFKPSFTVGKGKKRKESVGTITSKLKFGERSVVFAPHGEEDIGMWYLRIRDPAMMSNPLQGIVKLESIAVDPEDREEGLEGARVDIISGHILKERNVTPYKLDSRWASHLYPIYLTEWYIKSIFMSDIRFKALF